MLSPAKKTEVFDLTLQKKITFVPITIQMTLNCVFMYANCVTDNTNIHFIAARSIVAQNWTTPILSTYFEPELLNEKQWVHAHHCHDAKLSVHIKILKKNL